MTRRPRPLPRLSRRRALGSLGAAIATASFTNALPAPASAQEATPETDVADPQVLSLVQSVHPEKVYFYLPGFADETILAGIYALDVSMYQAITAEFAAAVRGAAEELLSDSAFAASIDRVPFQANDVVVAIGESDTDDLLSWFEILRHALELRRPSDRIRLVNQAISGQSTGEMLGRVSATLALQPDWILCGPGGNDAVRYGRQATKTRVSIAETKKNLAELQLVVTAQSDAKWVWLTRWSIDEARIAAYQPFQLGQFTLRREDFDAISEVILERPEPVVDLRSVFGHPPNPELLREDGLHPSLAGQMVIARAVVERLAG